LFIELFCILANTLCSATNISLHGQYILLQTVAKEGHSSTKPGSSCRWTNGVSLTWYSENFWDTVKCKAIIRAESHSNMQRSARQVAVKDSWVCYDSFNVGICW